jgi:hypothetical protein
VVIHDPHEMGLAIDPLEDDSPLVVDPDRIELVEHVGRNSEHSERIAPQKIGGITRRFARYSAS